MFLKPNILLYLRHNDLIVGSKDNRPTKLEIPTDLFRNLEIYNPEGFVDIISQFVTQLKEDSNRALIVLDTSVVFEKAYKTSGVDKKLIESNIESYRSMVPLDAGNRIMVRHQSSGALYVFVTNYLLIGLLKDALKASSIHHLEAIAPSRLFTVSGNLKSSQLLSSFLNDKSAMKAADFNGGQVF